MTGFRAASALALGDYRRWRRVLSGEGQDTAWDSRSPWCTVEQRRAPGAVRPAGFRLAPCPHALMSGWDAIPPLRRNEGIKPARPYRFRDVDGTPLHLLCRVEQIAVDRQNGALPARLHQQGQVVGWDTAWLHVCMDRDRALVVLWAELVRVLDAPWGR